MGQTDQSGPPPGSRGLQIGQGAVVVAAAHADTIAGAVESHQRNQDQVEMASRAAVAAAPRRFGNAEAIRSHRLAGDPTHEAKFDAGSVPDASAQDRKIDRFSALAGGVQQGTWIELAVGGPICRDSVGTSITILATKQSSNQMRMLTLGLGTQCSPARAQCLAEMFRVSHGGKGRDTPRLCRCRPLFLNQEVQVGTLGSASGFPLEGGLAQRPRFYVPRAAIRLKKIPRPRSDTAGDV